MNLTLLRRTVHRQERYDVVSHIDAATHVCITVEEARQRGIIVVNHAPVASARTTMMAS